jgi:hypothetical protein
MALGRKSRERDDPPRPLLPRLNPLPLPLKEARYEALVVESDSGRSWYSDGGIFKALAFNSVSPSSHDNSGIPDSVNPPTFSQVFLFVSSHH